MKKQSTLSWSILFGFIFLLSQTNNIIDYTATPRWLGFPVWLWWMISVHLIFLVALYFFVNQKEG